MTSPEVTSRPSRRRRYELDYTGRIDCPAERAWCAVGCKVRWSAATSRDVEAAAAAAAVMPGFHYSVAVLPLPFPPAVAP